MGSDDPPVEDVTVFDAEGQVLLPDPMLPKMRHLLARYAWRGGEIDRAEVCADAWQEEVPEIWAHYGLSLVGHSATYELAQQPTRTFPAV